MVECESEGVEGVLKEKLFAGGAESWMVSFFF
jgi:hypothetical protein